MSKRMIAAALLGVVLAGGPTYAAETCVAFSEVDANGGTQFCFSADASTTAAILADLDRRDRVLVGRKARVANECKMTASFNASDPCRVRIARETPLPAPSEPTLSLLQRVRQEWGQ